MIGPQPRGQRNELRPDRVGVRFRPVDRRDHVGRDAHGHRRAAEPFARVLDKRRVDELLDRSEQFVRGFYRVLPLPDMIEKRPLVDVAILGDGAPKLALTYFGVSKRLGRRRRVYHSWAPYFLGKARW